MVSHDMGDSVLTEILARYQRGATYLRRDKRSQSNEKIRLCSLPGHLCICGSSKAKVEYLQITVFIYSQVGGFQISEKDALFYSNIS